MSTVFISTEWDPPSADFGLPDVRTIDCERCGGSGEISRSPIATPYGPDYREERCEECCGTGKVDVVVGAIGFDDLDEQQ